VSLKEALAKKYGNSISSGSEAKDYDDMVWFNTGSHTLNKAINPLGRGIPTRCITEFFGDYATGKTLLSTYCLKDAQAKDGIAVLVDVEGSFNKEFAKSLGINLDELIVFAPTELDKDGKIVPLTYNTVEDRINDTIDLIRQEYGDDKPICIVWDSLAATNSERDLEETKDRGSNAKEVKFITKRLRPKINATNTALIIINQVYDNITTVPTAEPLKATGGRGVAYHSHIRVSFLQKKGKVGKIENDNPDGDEDALNGVRLHFFIDKNRVGPPFKKGTVDFLFDKDGSPQLDYYSGYMDYMISNGLVDTKTKGWVKVGDNKYRKGELERLLQEHPELL
jgi:recombination protein RecA